VIVLGDLPRGSLAAQVVHAAGESAGGPVPPDTHAVVLAARSSAELEALAARLAGAGIAHVLIREPDPPFNGAATALGIRPGPRAPLRRFVSSLPLVR